MECKHCKKVFSTKQSLEYHLSKKVCLKKKAPVCEHCNVIFSSKQKLDYHLSNEVCLRTIEAPVCGRCKKLFKSKQSLDYHLRNKVCDKVSATFCGYCEKRHSSSEKLKSHLLRCNQHFCGNKKWHNTRCTMEYMFGGAEHLQGFNFIRRSVLRKKEIDDKLPLFDKIAGVPWENVAYWEGICPRCGHKRKEDHIWTCVKNERDRLAKYDINYLEHILTSTHTKKN